MKFSRNFGTKKMKLSKTSKNDGLPQDFFGARSALEKSILLGFREKTLVTCKTRVRFSFPLAWIGTLRGQTPWSKNLAGLKSIDFGRKPGIAGNWTWTDLPQNLKRSSMTFPRTSKGLYTADLFFYDFRKS